MNKLQLILPVYHDWEALDLLLPTLLKQGWNGNQITVVDASAEAPFPVQNPWGIQVLHCRPEMRGRARQMNEGVRNSQSEALLFLHADSTLPDNAQDLVLGALENSFVGGGFSRRFDSPSRFLHFTCFLADLRGKWTGWYFGDQAIFCSRKTFEAVGGFPDISPFEDLEFCRRLKRQGRLTLLKPAILSSARRFEKEGTLPRTLKDFGLTLRYFFKHRTLK